MSNWNAEHFRITLFVPTSLPSPKDVLPRVFGVDVDSFAEKNFGSEMNAESDWEEGRLSVRCQPGRLDFYIGPRPESAIMAPLLPNGLATLPKMVGAVRNWIADADIEVVRIALAGRLMLFVNDRDDGYDKFAEKVKLVNVKKNEQSDINFQVNLPSLSKAVEGLKLNVITAWAVAYFKTLHLTPNMASATSEDKHFLHCVPDLNTDADRVEPLPKDDVSKLLKELEDIFFSTLEEGVS